MLNHRHTRRRTLCPVSEKSLLKDIEKDEKLHKIQIVHGYIHHKRLIPQTIYCKLKALRQCENCHKNITYPPEIHHLKPVKLQGSNTDIKNLLAVCRECHKILDKEELWEKS
jgi:predicted restriction endonuclease